MVLVSSKNATPANVGIGISAPMGSLDVARGTAEYGTAVFRGTEHASHFNYSTAEDTYIRGGKIGARVLINDSHHGNVGIGTTLATNPNGYKLAVNGTIGAKAVKVENSSTIWADYVFLPTTGFAPSRR